MEQTLSPFYLPRDPEMASAADPTESALFDWSDFLNFDIVAALNTPFAIFEPGSGPEQEPESDESQQSESVGRLRKRGLRLFCPNFVAGMVPFACLELDKKLEEKEESALPGISGPTRWPVARSCARCRAARLISASSKDIISTTAFSC